MINPANYFDIAHPDLINFDSRSWTTSLVDINHHCVAPSRPLNIQEFSSTSCKIMDPLDHLRRLRWDQQQSGTV